MTGHRDNHEFPAVPILLNFLVQLSIFSFSFTAVLVGHKGLATSAIKNFLVDFFSNTILGLFASARRSASIWLYILSLLSKPNPVSRIIIIVVVVVVSLLFKSLLSFYFYNVWKTFHTLREAELVYHVQCAKIFGKIRLESEWNTTFWVRLKIFGSNGTTQKVVLFSGRNVPNRILSSILQSQLWYQF